MSFKCKQCGDCCHFISFDATLSEDEKEWLNAHKNVKVVGSRLIFSNPCKYLHKCGDHYTCDLHSMGTKPEICKRAGEKECKLCKKLYKKI